jgi:shikimate dehydrogenase
MMINAKTSLYCIFGNPAQHSLSPALHNTAFAELGINAAYLAFEPSRIKDAVAAMKSLPIMGASVTIPFKSEIIPFLDFVDPLAEKIGAVNTVINRDGVLAGYNTDGEGACGAIEASAGDASSLKVLILGTGGSARAIAFTLLDRGAKVSIAGRTGRTQTELVNNLSSHFKNIGSLSLADLDKETAARFDVIVNTTPLGMKQDDPLPLDPSLLSPGQTVFDIVYRPHETAFLRAAEEQGCAKIYGIEMLIRQAAAQCTLWTEKEAPTDAMRTALKEFLPQ